MIAAEGGFTVVAMVLVLILLMVENPHKDEARKRGVAHARNADRKDREARLKAELAEWKRERQALYVDPPEDYLDPPESVKESA